MRPADLYKSQKSLHISLPLEIIKAVMVYERFALLGKSHHCILLV